MSSILRLEVAVLELMSVVLGVIGLGKALGGWAAPLVARYRPRGVIDRSASGFDAGSGPAPWFDGGG
jgi:hypothetical protein